MAITVIIVYLFALVGTLAWATRSGAESLSMPAAMTTSAPDSCKPAARAIRFYSARTHSWQALRHGRLAERLRWPTCYLARRAASEWHERAEKARTAYLRWHAYHYEWTSWLPDKWRRIGVCETGLNWQHSNSSYEGAFGFAVSTWDQFKPRANPRAGPYPADAWQGTPRQQYEVALAVYRMFGLSGWGCRNA